MTFGERQLVERILEAIGPPGAGVVVGPGDDAAVVEGGRGRLVLTIDSQREDVHFRRHWMRPEELGRRAVAVAASDIGAMGARPRWSLCAASAPAVVAPDWLEDVFRGLGEGGRELGCPVVGGDLAVGEKVELVVTVAGTLDEGLAPLRRDGARPGHGCWVLGDIGHAAAGRALLERGSEDPELAPYLCAYRLPRPPLALGRALATETLAAAMMDVSDGLGIDLDRMCRASGVGVEVDEAALGDDALQEVARGLGADALGWQVAGGDDYALLAAVAAADEERVGRLAEAHAVRARRVGEFTDQPSDVVLVDGDGGRRRLAGGWDPFRRAEGSP